MKICSFALFKYFQHICVLFSNNDYKKMVSRNKDEMVNKDDYKFGILEWIVTIIIVDFDV